MKEVNKAWAIETRSVDIDGSNRNGFIGKFWFDGHCLASYTDGQRIAIFKTREKARFYLPKVKKCYKRARVVRVKVTVETVGGRE